MAIKESHNSGDTTAYSGNSVNWLSMAFLTTSEYTIKSVKLKLYKSAVSADDPGIITVSIRATTGAASSKIPTGADLCSGVINGSNLISTVPGEWVFIDFGDGASLSDATTYAIVIRSANVTGATVAYSWRGGGTYADGNRAGSGNSGSSWTAYVQDHVFETHDINNFSNSTLPIDKTYSKKLVVVSNDEVWYESPAGTMVLIDASKVTLNAAKPVSLIPIFQKVFIANASVFKVLDLVTVKLPTSEIGSGAVSVPIYGAILSGDSSGAGMVCDFVDASTGSAYVYGYQLGSIAFTSSDTVVDTDSTTSVSFALASAAVTAPHFYNWTPYANDTSTYGTMPTYATIGYSYRARVCLSGNKEAPFQWYMPRQANPWDWAYVANDAQSPIAGGNADMGQLGDKQIAAIPYSDDYLLIGCAASTWVMRGDPAYQGSLDKVANIGWFGKDAWCWGPSGMLYFMGLDGIYKITPPNFIPVPVSHLYIPDLITDLSIDQSVHRITMAFDKRRFGINICITTLSDGSNNNYWYDIKTEGFFPETYQTQCGVFSQCFYEAGDDDYRRLLLGCNDGYIRYFLDSAKDDDIGATNAAISAYCLMPIVFGNDDNDSEGKLQTLTVYTAGGKSSGSFGDTDEVQIEIFVGDSPEEVLENIKDGDTAFVSAVISTPTFRKKFRTKAKGGVFGIKCSSVASSETFAIEKIQGQIKPTGGIR